MCGIVALWHRDGRSIDRAALRLSVNALVRRGPDDEGYVLIDSRSGRVQPCRGADTRAEGLPELAEVSGEFDLALGHRRLAIVDESVTGHQPMSAQAGRLWIVFNGMIYNFRELRTELESAGYRFHSRSDTEVVLNAYARWGADCVSHFNGMWSFALWDGESRSLLVSRDRLGIKPLVYRVTDDDALFASELAAFGALGALADGIEPRGLHHYLSLMQVPAPYTIYKGVLKLRPARNLRVTRSEIAEERYWQPQPGKSISAGPDEAAQELAALIRDAVRLRLVADVPVGSFVSGGVDSGAIAALASAGQTDGALPTYAIAVPDEASSDESKWSRAIAAHIDSDHCQIDLNVDHFQDFVALADANAEPFAISSVLGVYLVARAARGNAKVLLSGDGGDELFAGYVPRYIGIDGAWDEYGRRSWSRLRSRRAIAAGQWIRWHGRTRATMRRLRALSLFVSDAHGRDFEVMHRRCLFNDIEKRALYTPAWRRFAGEQDTIAWLQSQIPACTGDRILRRQLHDVETSLHNEMTAKLDRGTMACGIEGRVPLLDHRVVEMALSLPAHYRYAQDEGKWLLRRAVRGLLPAEILTRPKHGFTIPLATWFRTALREFVHDTLSPQAVKRAGVFEYQAIEDVLGFYHREPNYHTAHMVFTLLCFQLWYDRWGASQP